MKRYAMLLALTLLVPASAFAFGAIAVDDGVGEEDPAYGFSTGESSQRAAEKSALGYCQEHGDNCKVIVWFKTCGAYASSKHYYGYGYGDTKAKATSDALKMCGRKSCEVLVAKCE